MCILHYTHTFNRRVHSLTVHHILTHVHCTLYFYIQQTVFIHLQYTTLLYMYTVHYTFTFNRRVHSLTVHHVLIHVHCTLYFYIQQTGSLTYSTPRYYTCTLYTTHSFNRLCSFTYSTPRSYTCTLYTIHI